MIRAIWQRWKAWDQQQRVNDFCRMIRAKREAEAECQRRQDAWIASLTWRQKQQIIEAAKGWPRS